MSADRIQLAMLWVQVFGLIGLVLYVCETWRLRIAAQRQVEAMSKPCLTLRAQVRDGADVILNMHGAVGNMNVAVTEGRYVVQNIGSGVALEVHYHFTRPDDQPYRERYIPHVKSDPENNRVMLLESANHYNREHEVVFRYQSLSGVKYRAAIHINQHVITSFAFSDVSSGSVLRSIAAWFAKQLREMKTE